MNSATDILKDALLAFKPPEKLTLSQWASRYARLSLESSSEGGRWKSIPYQVGIMDAMTDPDIEQVTVMKSARVGYTKMLNHLIGYHIHQDPCPIMVVQPVRCVAVKCRPGKVVCVFQRFCGARQACQLERPAIALPVRLICFRHWPLCREPMFHEIA